MISAAGHPDGRFTVVATGFAPETPQFDVFCRLAAVFRVLSWCLVLEGLNHRIIFPCFGFLSSIDVCLPLSRAARVGHAQRVGELAVSLHTLETPFRRLFAETAIFPSD
jgi:hypothetical protein